MQKQKQYTTGASLEASLAHDIYRRIAAKVAGYFFAFPNVSQKKAAEDLNLDRMLIRYYANGFKDEVKGDDTK